MFHACDRGSGNSNYREAMINYAVSRTIVIGEEAKVGKMNITMSMSLIMNPFI